MRHRVASARPVSVPIDAVLSMALINSKPTAGDEIQLLIILGF